MHYNKKCVPGQVGNVFQVRCVLGQVGVMARFSRKKHRGQDLSPVPFLKIPVSFFRLSRKVTGSQLEFCTFNHKNFA